MSKQEIIDFVKHSEQAKQHGDWKIIPVNLLSSQAEIDVAHRLNSLGSLYYFSKVGLRNHRLSEHFHLDICLGLECEHLKEVLEVPRDHFKSTICSESAPIWWALPFTEKDADYMRALGYDESWIRWMRRAHNQDTRTCLVSENITNAAKLGVRIDGHYQNNKFFKNLFPEIALDSSCTWTQFSKTHKRSARSKPHGEGTFDYIGVGGALQSRHYDRVVQDDLVGKAAIESDSIMEKTIEYHKLLVGAFDSERGSVYDNDEIIVGNRWSWKDLNSYVRENEKYFRITNHSALGGCCAKHPKGLPIFPEEFTVEKLERFAQRLGPYLFSCQFLNDPISPEASEFDIKNLRYFTWIAEINNEFGRRTAIRHEVKDGNTRPDTPVSSCSIAMVVDPNHSGSDGRCNHAIIIVGVIKSQTKDKPDDVYLLDYWADSTSYDQFISKIYEKAEKFKLSEFYLETIAAQKYLKFHLDYRNRVEGRRLRVNELKTPKNKDAKTARIKAFGPTLENQCFWVQRTHTQFIKELSEFPFGKYRDLLDTLGYAIEVLGKGQSRGQQLEYLKNYQPVMGSGPCGY